MKEKASFSKPRIAVTMGDPLGIGAEVLLKAITQFQNQATFKVFGDAEMLSALPEDFLIPIVRPHKENWGAHSAGVASIAYLDAAMKAYHRGEIDALVTAPISKAHVQAAGFAFPGHTEYLASQTKTQDFLMMMAGPRLRVTLVTIHEALARVPTLLTIPRILKTIQLTYDGLKKFFQLPQPRIAVCGLNPHAGEEGILGREEIEIIRPAIEFANQQGYACSGPKVPDAVFHEAYAGHWDAVICMYHDQGLIPFKMIHFSDGVNVTLGLPLIRTSPDHGTAFDIAGQGIANPESMIAAIQLALEMLSRK